MIAVAVGEQEVIANQDVLAMVSKEEQRPIKACYNFFSPRSRHCLRLDEVATVTQADVWVKKITELLPQS